MLTVTETKILHGLREVKELHGSMVHALDGEIGRVDEILFDDEHWTVRYLIVNTGNWLVGRKVLISPMALGLLDWDRFTLNVNLTREQIRNSPGVEADQPVSRQWEMDYYDYYAWPYYWGGMGGWGSYWYPGTLLHADTPPRRGTDQTWDHDAAHLRSTKEVTGYGISATDGHLGHIQDFIVNDETWRISYLAVDTQDWWPGKKVLLPPDWIVQVNLAAKNVTVNVTRDQVRNAPEWDPYQPISHTFEDQLYSYYARQHPATTHGSLYAVSAQPKPGSQRQRQEELPAQTGAKQKSAVVAIYATHNEAETAIRDLQKLGFDMTKLSIVGKDYHSEEDVVGYYNTGDRMKSWGLTGAFWGGIWSLLFGSGIFLIPGIGPLLAAGPIVAWIVGALEGAALVGGVSVLGAALFSIGIPDDKIIAYETQIKAGKFVVIAHDIQSELDRAMIALEGTRHTSLEQHGRVG